MNNIKVGAKNHPCIVSEVLSKSFLSETKKLIDNKIPPDSQEYSNLVVASYHEAIRSGYYAKGGLKRMFRDYLAPSLKMMTLCIDKDQMLEMMAHLYGTDAATLKANASKQIKKKKGRK